MHQKTQFGRLNRALKDQQWAFESPQSSFFYSFKWPNWVSRIKLASSPINCCQTTKRKNSVEIRCEQLEQLFDSPSLEQKSEAWFPVGSAAGYGDGLQAGPGPGPGASSPYYGQAAAGGRQDAVRGPGENIETTVLGSNTRSVEAFGVHMSDEMDTGGE